MFPMGKEIRINVRTTAEIKRDFEIAAREKGHTVSSLVNSMAVKIIREEKTLNPKAFEDINGREIATSSKTKQKINKGEQNQKVA